MERHHDMKEVLDMDKHGGEGIEGYFYCGWPWPAAHLNFIQITHQFQV